MSFNRGLFSSQKLDWRTPEALYQGLKWEFYFDFDPCPTNPKFNGLKVEWGKSNFVNPPYGREIGKWLKKGYEEWQKGKTVVFLIPSRTDTRWWHDYVMKATEIRFIKGRLKFGDAKNSAPFPSCVVIFGEKEIKRVYIAGAYSADNVLGVLNNMRKGMRKGVEVLLAGYTPFVPWFDYHFSLMLRENETLTVEDYYRYSMAWLEVSDVLLVLPDSENSKGTQAEIQRAKKLGILIVYSIEELLKVEDGKEKAN